MILQELIRNIVTYKGIIKPLLRVWQSYLLTIYTAQQKQVLLTRKQKRHFEAKNTMEGAPKNAVLVPMYAAGTLTITSQFSISGKESYEKRIKSAIGIATFSTSSVIMLGVEGLMENIAETEQTHFLQSVTCEEARVSLYETTRNKTTGFITLEIYSFLFFEIHEKGESLGERSLSHDEALLVHIKEGGEQS